MNKLAVVLTSLLSLAACGSKDKKQAATTPEPAPAADTTEAKSTESDESIEPDGAKQASLQPVLYFQLDAFELSGEARSTLDENAEWMKSDTTRTLTIEGHTDETGTSGYNLALGEKRARAARDYLIRLGVDESRVRVLTYGEERPAGSDDALNRRSVFVATRK